MGACSEVMRGSLGWTKARDDMEDWDVAGSQLTVLPPACSLWRVEGSARARSRALRAELLSG